MSALARWSALDLDEKTLAVQAAAWIAAAAVGLRVFGVKRMLRAADSAGGTAAPDAEYAALVTAVDRAGRYVPGGTCLAQSLALTRMLRKKGVPAKVRIGVGPTEPFAAHAWVEVAGAPITPAAGRPLPSPAR